MRIHAFTFVAVAAIQLYGSATSQCSETVDQEVVFQVGQLLNKDPSHEPITYVVAVQRLRGEQKRLERASRIEVLRHHEFLRMTRTQLVDGFEELVRPAVKGWLINANGAFAVVRNRNDSYFRLVRQIGPYQRGNPANSKEMQLHREALYALGNWLAEWIVLPAVQQQDGYALTRAEKTGSTYHISVLCNGPALSILNVPEPIEYDFTLNEQGLVETWSYPYSAEHPGATVSTDVHWSQTGLFLGSTSKLTQNGKLFVTWLTEAAEHSHAPIPESEFSLAHFGLQEPRFFVPPIYGIIAVVLGLFATAVWWQKRQR